MKLEEIRELAEGFVKENKWLCEQIEIAGSIRRGKPEAINMGGNHGQKRG